MAVFMMDWFGGLGITGTSGNDALTAPVFGTVTLGAGADVLTVNASSPYSFYTEVEVTDFTPGEDTLILQGFGESWDLGLNSLTLSDWQDWSDIDLAERYEMVHLPSTDPRGGTGSITRSFQVTENADGVHISARYIVDDGYIYTDGYDVYLTLAGVTLSDLQSEPGATAGDDTLQTALDYDWLHGLEGNDTLTALGNHITLEGGAGNDLLYDLGAHTQIMGGEGDDFAHIGPRDGAADGGMGNDTLEAVMTKTGVQMLTGGAGADTFAGLGFGENTKLAELRIADFNPEEDRLELTIGKVVHTIDLNALPDGFHLNTDDDGHQVLTWQGDGGTDRVVFEGLAPLPTLRLSDAADTFKTPVGHEIIDAGAGDDTIYAFKGTHDIRLGEGDDAIWARHDAVIDGGAGDDTMHLDFARNNVFDLTGGAGADTFSVEHVSADRTTSAVIADYQAGQDQVLINGVAAGADGLPEGARLSEDESGNSILHLGESQSITLLGVSNVQFLLLDDGTEIPTVPVAEEADPLPDDEEDLAFA